MFEKKYDFFELLLIGYRILFKKNGSNFEDNFSATIAVSGWLPKYGQTSNKQTAVCRLQ